MKAICSDFHGKQHVVDNDQLIDRLSTCGIYIADGTVLLIQDPRSLRWELPGGGVEKGETPEQGLTREFKEESGVTPAGRFTFIKGWEELFFDVVSQRAWRSKRRFYLIEKLEHADNLLVNGNGEDSATAKFVVLRKISTLYIAPNIRQLIEQVALSL
jgi:8-oxo-dGTP pyrophosphatase MutT (NUDIX family)